MRCALGLALLLTATVAHACSSDQRSKPFTFGTGGEAGSSSGGAGALDAALTDGPPSPDASGLCGNKVIPVVAERPNVYFVVDRSGSMLDPLPKSPYNKYVNARIAIGKVLRSIGHRLRYGAAVFPIPGGSLESCNPGKEVFPTQDGDPSSYAAAGTDGPALKKLLAVLAGFQPDGGTPTSPTLEALVPTLTALPGKTFVVLATDGAPNCNPSAVCGPSECMANIEGLYLDPNTPCVAPLNCCDPKVATDGPEMCVDQTASVKVVSDLLQAGIRTYVIGMPGTELYTQVLDNLAVAGGTAKPAAPYYIPAQDEEQLTAALKDIGIKVSISCSIDLDAAPPDTSKVNVYLDTALVQLDPVDGWTWTSDKSVELHGAACDKLKSGDVIQVQVVSGCPTSVK
ncbi:MAG: VWA domain-containing protein [Polyangiaceae bacterium]